MKLASAFLASTLMFAIAIAIVFYSLATAQETPPLPQGVGGFTIKIGLIDFFMIQRGLMQLPDDHAKETLASIRAQITAQTAKPETK